MDALPAARWPREIAGTLIALSLVLLLAACAAPAHRTATSSEVALPPFGAPPDYQLGGASAVRSGVRIVERDRSDRPAPGVYSICYVNGFQSQPDEQSFWASRSGLLLHDSRGRLVDDPDWAGEHPLDIRTAAKRSALLAIEGSWIDGCAARGFKAVEPDNLDVFSRFGGDGVTRQDALDFARLLVQRAHRDGLAVGQKNAAELGATGRDTAGFDFAVTEECEAYRECGAYTAVYGRRVIEIEYTDEPHAATVFAAACRARGRTISIVQRDRDLVPAGHAGHSARWCP